MSHPASVFPFSGVLSIQLDGNAGLSLFPSIFIRVVVLFGIGFIAVQDKLESILPTVRASLIIAMLEKL